MGFARRLGCSFLNVRGYLANAMHYLDITYIPSNKHYYHFIRLRIHIIFLCMQIHPSAKCSFIIVPNAINSLPVATV